MREILIRIIYNILGSPRMTCCRIILDLDLQLPLFYLFHLLPYLLSLPHPSFYIYIHHRPGFPHTKPARDVCVAPAVGCVLFGLLV